MIYKLLLVIILFNISCSAPNLKDRVPKADIPVDENNIIDLTNKLTDFSKTASLMKELDLIISSDTSVAHLAGALNIPIWIP
ncbi:MAG: glycosyltransferase family 9 protein, partial [Flavobacteriales bacterium]